MVEDPINEYVSIEILSVVCALVHHHRGEKKLSIGADENERCAPELCFLTSLGPPHHSW